jgi:hypothetical protein
MELHLPVRHWPSRRVEGKHPTMKLTLAANYEVCSLLVCGFGCHVFDISCTSTFKNPLAASLVNYVVITARMSTILR